MNNGEQYTYNNRKEVLIQETVPDHRLHLVMELLFNPSQFSVSFMTLTFLKSTGHLFHKMSVDVGLFYISS